MSKITSAVKAFIADENGVTAIEYGLLAALIGVAMVVGAGAVGNQVVAKFNEVIVALGGDATPLPNS